MSVGLNFQHSFRLVWRLSSRDAFGATDDKLDAFKRQEAYEAQARAIAKAQADSLQIHCNPAPNENGQQVATCKPLNN
jgi:hypothetical protein